MKRRPASGTLERRAVRRRVREDSATGTLVVELLLPGFLARGLNGSAGVGFRVHHHAARSRRDEVRTIIASAGPAERLVEPVSVHYERSSLRLMDWDNLGASFKLLGDALVALGYLRDDSPDVIRDFSLAQVRVRRRVDQATRIVLRELAETPDQRSIP